jgi:diguanylate cyclase (GGDEF)-like protein
LIARSDLGSVLNAASRVMIVDDDAVLRSGAARLLRNHGYQVDMAAGADEALTFALRHRYAVIVCDLLLPRLDGARLIERLRALQCGAQYIIVTGASPDEAARCLADTTYDAIVFKPWRDEQLLEVVKAQAEVEGRENSADVLPAFSGTLLIIEDNPGDRHLLMANVREAVGKDCRIRVAGTLTQAAAIIRNEPALAVVLTDLSLPDAQGVEVVTRLQELGVTAPLVVVTGSSDESLAVRAVEAGASEYVTKGQLDPRLVSRALRFAMQRKRSQLHLTRVALTDPLTGAANRAFFESHLAHWLFEAHTGHKGFAMFFVDLDRFKDVNDTFGHAVGDALLIAVTARIQECLHDNDLLARIGGDEIAILSRRAANRPESENLRRVIKNSLNESFALSGCDVHISASVGVAIFPDDGAESTELLRAADRDMYRDKGHRRRTSSPPVEFDGTQQPAELELRRAFDEREFVLLYQPIVDMETREVRALEAFLRWRRPDGSLTLPNGFLRGLDVTGLINPVGDWVLSEACTVFREVKKATGTIPTLSLNVTASQLSARAFAYATLRTLRDYDIVPEKLQFEVCEAVLADPSRAVQDTLAALQDGGIGVCIDDFGVGTSSITRVSNSSAQSLKIDRTVVRDLLAHNPSRATAAACVAIGRGLGINVVAEGVEQVAQHDMLRELGCTEAQGRLYARPLPPDVLLAWLRE